jgi:hypothetical protein
VGTVSFNIGQQNGGVINNVAGDQTIYGGQTGTIVSVQEALAAVGQVRRELDGCALAPDTRAAATRELHGMEQDLRQPSPDKATIGESLTRLTKLLVTTGALATGTTSLLSALSGLATWLGHFGTTALRLLSRSA